MRILFVSNGFPPTALGGVEVYTLEIASALRHRGHEVWVFCRESNFNYPDYLLLHDEVESIPVVRVVNDFKEAARFTLSYQDRRIEDLFRDVLDQLHPDLVHFQHLIGLSARLPEVAGHLQYPVLMSLHDFWPICHRVHLLDRWGQICAGPFQGGDCVHCVFDVNLRGGLLSSLRRIIPWVPQFMRRWWMHWRGGATTIPWPSGGEEIFKARYNTFKTSLQWCQLLLAPSAFVREMFIQNHWEGSEIRVLPLSIKLPERPVISSRAPDAVDTLRIGYIGWFQPQKGVHILLEAFQHLPSAKASLHLFGPFDPSHTYMRSLEDRIRKDSRIHLRGPFQAKMRAQIYAQIDVLVIPSISPETFSRVAHEALMYGIPVVASRAGALAEIIVDGINGYTFPPGDVGALRRILEDLVTRSEQLRTLSLPGPVSVTSVEEHIGYLEHIYQSTLATAATINGF